MLLIGLSILIILISLLIFTIWRLLYRRNPSHKENTLHNNIFGLKAYKPPEKFKIIYNASLLNSKGSNFDFRESKCYKRNPVPKKIYRAWCNSNPENGIMCRGRNPDMEPFYLTQKNLPDWEQIIYGDKEIEKFLEKEFGNENRITKAYYLINPKYGAARADLFRYLIIYKYGGLYLDFKSCVTKGPIPEIPPDMDMWISSWNGNNPPHVNLFPETGEYQNWYIYARKGSLVLKDVIEKIVNNIHYLYESGNDAVDLTVNKNAKGKVLSLTGPVAMTIGIISSKHNKTAYYDNSINKFFSYGCGVKDASNNVSAGHYSFQTEPLIIPNANATYIPKTVYMTYNELDVIPQYARDNINKFCSGYDVKIYDDDMCLDFLDKYYGSDAVEIFKNMKLGAHKADFWRYCILYVFGGYYFDIKTDFQMHIDKIFDGKLPKTWYSVIGDSKKRIFNGIIVTPPNNKLLLDAITYIYKNPVPYSYLDYKGYLYKILKKNTKNNKVSMGKNLQKNNWTCVLFQEECDRNCEKNCDRRGHDCIIKNENGQKVFNTRYKDFPWSHQNTFPIDVVYTWAGETNSDDLRLSYNNELKYSLRSVIKFMPWVNRIFILMNPPAKVPSWFNNRYSEKITIIDHYDTFFDPNHLPCTNSNSIETTLANIPGLSEHFVYFNDDVFIGRRMSYLNFFTEDGRMAIHRMKLENVREMQDLYKERILNFPLPKTSGLGKHIPLTNKKSVIKRFNNKYPEYIEWIRNIKTRRFRGTNVCLRNNLEDWCQQQHAPVAIFGYEIGEGVKKDFLKSDMIFTNHSNRSLYTILKQIKDEKTLFFCINSSKFDDNTLKEKKIKLVNDFFESFYREKPFFEK